LKNYIKLQSKDIYLRPICIDDANYDYPNWLNDPIVCKYNSHGDINYSRELAIEYIKSVQNFTTNKVFAICTNNHKHIGNISLQNISNKNNNAELAILLGNTSYMNKGYSKQASKLILNYGFKQLNLHRIYCGTNEYNIAMQKLAYSLGMKQEGIQIDAMYKNNKYINIIQFAIINKG